MKVTVKGGKEAAAALRSIGNQVTARRVGRKAIQPSAEIIRAKAASLAPDDPATGVGKYLRSSIAVGPGKSRDKDQVWVRIGIDESIDPPKDVARQNGKGSYRDPGVAGVSVIMEFGAPAGHIAPRPFMGPAWESEKLATAQRITDAVLEEAEKAAQRAARKRAKA